jgi:uncharacterized protein GlcG (DUF336 family)
LNYLLTLDGIIAFRCGILLVEQGKIIGGSGCSGGTDLIESVVTKLGVRVEGRRSKAD